MTVVILCNDFELLQLRLCVLGLFVEIFIRSWLPESDERVYPQGSGTPADCIRARPHAIGIDAGEQLFQWVIFGFLNAKTYYS